MKRRNATKRREFVIHNNDGNDGRRIGGAALRKGLGFKRYGDAPHHVYYRSQADVNLDLYGDQEHPPYWSGEATDAELAEVERLIRKSYRDEFGIEVGSLLDVYHD